MSEENKNRNKDKGKQNNPSKNVRHNSDVEIANENSEFLNINGKKNKRKRK